MKNVILIIVFSIGLVPMLRAQITITSNDIQPLGVIYDLGFNDTLPVYIGKAGKTAQIFDLTALPPGIDNGTISDAYLPQDDSFPNANYAVETTLGNSHLYHFDFYLATDTVFYSLGYYEEIGNHPNGNSLRLASPSLTYRLPITLGTQWTSVSGPDTSGIYVDYDTTVSVCDAFGTIKLPDTLSSIINWRSGEIFSSGSYDCVRIKNIVHYRSDSAGVIFPSTISYVYDYLTKGGMNISVSINNADSALSSVVSTGVYMTIPGGALSAVNEPKIMIPGSITLSQNYPNPASPSTNIDYTLPHSGYVSLKIYNALGKEVATLVNSEVSAGLHTALWQPQGLPDGVYFYQFSYGNGKQVGMVSQTRRLLLIK